MPLNAITPRSMLGAVALASALASPAAKLAYANAAPVEPPAPARL